MNKAPKRLLPHGLRTIAKGMGQEYGEITRQARKKLERGVKTGFTYDPNMIEKSYWDHETQTVKTVNVRNLERQDEILSGKRYRVNRKKQKRFI